MQSGVSARYRISCEEKVGYLHFRITGENAPENVCAYLREVGATCLARGCLSALIEENLEGPGLSLAEIFGVAEDGSRPRSAHTLRLAYVDTNPGHPHKNMKFAETVASNRGVNVRLFRDVGAAEAWLAQPAED